MATWTKTLPNGDVVELSFSAAFVYISTNGGEPIVWGRVVRLDSEIRARWYKDAPKVDSRGRQITHAVGPLLLNEQEASEVDKLHRRALRDAQAAASRALDDEIRRLHADKFAEAAATGKPVVISSWRDHCNDPGEQCDIDICNRCAMPDGTFATLRQHTW